MASSALREILVSFGVEFDTKDLQKGIGETEGGLNSLINIGHKLAQAWEEIALVEVVKTWVEAVVGASVELLHASERIGVSADQLKFWRYAGQLAGVEAGQLDVALQRLSRAIGTPGPEAQQLALTLKSLGVNGKDAHGKIKQLDQLLPEIVEGFSKLKEGPEQTAAAMQLFGRSGAALVPLLKKGKEGLAELKAEFSALGGAVDEDLLKNSEALEESQIRLGVTWKYLREQAVGWLLPILTKMSDYAIELSVAFAKWNKETGILQMALKTGLVYSLYVLIPLVWGLVAPLLATVAAFAAVVLLVDDFKTAWEGGDSLIGRIIDKVFGPGTTAKIVAWIKHVIQEIQDFWAKIDFGGALTEVGTLVEAITSIFGDGSKSAQEKFQELLDFIGGNFRDVMKALLGDTAGDVVAEFVGAITEVISAFDELYGIVKGVLQGIADAITTILGPPIAWVSDALANLHAGQDADERNNKSRAAAGEAPSAAAFDTTKKPWYQRVVASVVGFQPQDAVPVPNAAAPSAPGGAPVAPVVNMSVQVAPGTTAQQARALGKAGADGARAGLAAPNRAAAAGLGRTK